MHKQERKVHQTLALFFGKNWIEKEMGKVKLDGFHDMNPMNIARMDIHPLIRAVVDTQIKLEQLGQAGAKSFPIGKSETLQSLLHENLTILEPDLDRDDVGKRLRDKNEFLNVEYELAIAAGYKRMGYRVEFLPKSSKKRTGEFYVVDESGLKILIECKKKEMTTAKQNLINSWWEEFQHLMTRQLKNKKKFYGVAIRIPANPPKNETHSAVKEIMEAIVAGKEGPVVVVDNKYQVFIKKFGEGGKPVRNDEFRSFGAGADFGVSIAKQDKAAWPLGKFLPEAVHEPIKICGYSPPDSLEERASSVLSTLKDAYGQLEHDKPNIVYIDFNASLMQPGRSRVLSKSLPLAIAQKLEKDLTKVTAVVLTNLKLLGDSQRSGFHANEETIYNTRAATKLPSDFRIYGDEKSGKSILVDMRDLLSHQV